MIRPGTFERVYAALKEQLREGRFRPGERLEPAILSDQLNASVTPVRDALHRLTGERLVEAPRHEGFRAPLLTETMLRHLYKWQQDVLLLAIAGPAIHLHRAYFATHEGTPEARPPAILAELAAASENPEHLVAFKNAAERLEPYLRLETEFLENVAAELDAIVASVDAQDRQSLRRLLIAYHRRRQAIVPALLSRHLGDVAD